jgi:hypothetical protein
MPIRTVSLFTYRTNGRDWTPAQIAVLRFVRALKGENVGDRRDVCVNGAARSLGDENADEAFEWFGEMAVRVLEEELETTRVVLVPVPDSASALDVARSRTSAPQPRGLGSGPHPGQALRRAAPGHNRPEVQ